MSREQFDEELRSRIKDYSPPVDADKIWKNIQGKRPKNYTGIIALMLFLAGTGAGIYFFSQSNDNLVAEQSQSVVEITLNDNVTSISVQKNASEFDENTELNSTQNSTAQNNIDNSSTQANKIDTEINQSNTLNTKNYDKNTIANTSKTKTKNFGEVENSDVNSNSNLNFNSNTNQKTTLETKVVNRKEDELSNTSNDLFATDSKAKKEPKNEASQYNLVNQESNIADNFEIEQRNNQLEEETIYAKNETNNASNTNDKKINQEEIENIAPKVATSSNNSKDEMLSENLNENANSIDNTNERESQTSIMLNNETFEEHLLVERTTTEKSSNTTKKAYDDPTKKRKSTNSKGQRYKSQRKTFELSLDVVGGPMFPIKSLSDKTESENNYLEQRQFTERALRGYKTEVSVSGEFKKFMYFKVGLDYAGFKESFIYKGENTIEYYDPNGIVSIEVNAVGDTTYVRDSLLITQVVSRNVNRINSYNVLDMSTSLGFKFSETKWSLFVDGGLAYNLLFKAKGQYLNEQLTPVYFTEQLTDGSLPLRKNLGVAVVGNMGFTYNIKPNLDFKIQAGYKRYFGDFSSKENPISQKYNFINLGLGIQYTFNNF